MGELSIEEKAKRYDEAIKRAKAMIKVAANQDESIGFANTIFPELKESEDERIRKTLIEYFNAYPKDYFGGLKKNYIVAWLEKQGGITKLSEEEQKLVVDFKAEDWYVSKVDGKIYNAKFMEKTPTNQTRKLEIEKAAMSATGIIEQEEWFIKGAEWSDKNPDKK